MGFGCVCGGFRISGAQGGHDGAVFLCDNVDAIGIAVGRGTKQEQGIIKRARGIQKKPVARGMVKTKVKVVVECRCRDGIVPVCFNPLVECCQCVEFGRGSVLGSHLCRRPFQNRAHVI